MTVVPLIYLIDTSGSMSGNRIEKINKIMKKTLDDLKCVINEEDYVIKVAMLSFATSCQWITDGLTDIKEFHWKDLDSEGSTSLGAAFKELNKKLCRDGILKFENNQRILRPIIILFSDGYPTDLYEYELKHLKENAWFSHSLRFAIGLDNETGRSVLIDFIQNPSCIIEDDNIDFICQSINSLSVTSVNYNIEHSHNNLLRNSAVDAEEIMDAVNTYDNDGWD